MKKGCPHGLNETLPSIPALTVDLVRTDLYLGDESPRDVPDRVLVDEVAGRGGRVLLLPALAVVTHLLLSEDSVPQVEVQDLPQERRVVIVIPAQPHHQGQGGGVSWQRHRLPGLLGQLLSIEEHGHRPVNVINGVTDRHPLQPDVLGGARVEYKVCVSVYSDKLYLSLSSFINNLSQ